MRSKRVKELFCRVLPPHIKPIGFGVEIEVEIKNKKIKWTPFRKATHFFPGLNVTRNFTASVRGPAQLYENERAAFTNG